MSVSINEISSAEKLFGIKYTEAERQMMLDNIETQIISAKKRREICDATPIVVDTIFDICRLRLGNF